MSASRTHMRAAKIARRRAHADARRPMLPQDARHFTPPPTPSLSSSPFPPRHNTDHCCCHSHTATATASRLGQRTAQEELIDPQLLSDPGARSSRDCAEIWLRPGGE